MTAETPAPTKVDIGILTVIPPELEAVQDALGDLQRGDGGGLGDTIYLHGKVYSELRRCDYTVVLAGIGKAGNASASALAKEMIERYRPSVILLVGIAAGMRNEVRIGEVVIVERVVAYEHEALTVGQDGTRQTEPQPKIFDIHDRIRQQIFHYNPDVKRLTDMFAQIMGTFPPQPEGREEEWQKHVASSFTCTAWVTIASGEKLLRDPQKLREVRRLHRKVAAADMEAEGIATACGNRVPWLVIRGISDFGDQLKDDRFHEFASRTAAAVLVDFLAYGLDLGERPVVSARPLLEQRPELPTREDCFGREPELRRLVAAILETKDPLPTIVLGPAGFGKSNLTIAALHVPEVAKFYGGRRYFVRLSDADSAERMLSAIAAGLKIQSGRDLLSAVKSHLSDAPTLLVLDNAETPWKFDRLKTEALLADLLGVSKLALVCSVRGDSHLAVPRMGDVIRLEPLGDAAARELFFSIARYVNREARYLEQLLARQGGLALGIKLLALNTINSDTELEFAWSRWQQERTAMLELPGADRSQMDSRSSLAISLEASIKSRNMTDDARRLLALLAWLKPAGVAKVDLIELLPSMTWQRALQAVSDTSDTGLVFIERSRLRMHSLIHEYVSASRQPGEEDKIRASSHYRSLARKLGPKVGGSGGDDAMERLIAERVHIESFIRDGLESSSATDAIDEANDLLNFMRFSGYGAPDLLMRASDVARSKGDYQRQARCLHSLGVLALARPAHREARESFKAALELYERTGDSQGKASCVQRLGDIALERSEYEESRQRFEEALALYKQVGSIRGQADCTGGLAEVDRERSEHKQAREKFKEAMDLYEQEGAVLGMAHCTLGLGVSALQKLEYGQAHQQIEQALTLYRKAGGKRGEANCIRLFGELAFRQKQYVETRQRLEEALKLYEQVNGLLGKAHCIKVLGELELALENYEQARRRLQEAQSLYEEVGYLLGKAHCLNGLGSVACAQAKYKEAREKYEQAFSIYQQMPEPYSIGQIHRSMARMETDPKLKHEHIAAARHAWQSIDFMSLVRELDEEFPS
jgi:nucleoside phosphorylase/tetratricopeptide (TPR) repeat protein